MRTHKEICSPYRTAYRILNRETGAVMGIEAANSPEAAFARLYSKRPMSEYIIEEVDLTPRPVLEESRLAELEQLSPTHAEMAAEIRRLREALRTISEDSTIDAVAQCVEWADAALENRPAREGLY